VGHVPALIEHIEDKESTVSLTLTGAAEPRVTPALARAHASTEWPLVGANVLLRPVGRRDAGALLQHVVRPQVLRYIAPPPATVDQFRAFVRWTERNRHRHVCLGIVPRASARPVGIVQMWSVASRFHTAEWGFALDDSWWGTGLFVAAAVLALDYAFGPLGVERLEARVGVANGRASGVLRKLGAVREGVLRSNGAGVSGDHAMWSVLADEWSRVRERIVERFLEDGESRREESLAESGASGRSRTSLAPS
jgi:RimJ/RimL family protein N-acetyltransferase